jgi:hypothetical protein
MDIDAWNQKVLKQKGIDARPMRSQVVRNVGDLQEATLWDGVTKVRRQDSIYVEGEGLVKCINSELHFVFQTPKTMKGWGLYCTCGSIAGTVGISAYSKLASPIGNGKIVACIRLLTTKNNTGIGEHADGSHE